MRKSYLILAIVAIASVGCQKIISLANISKDFTYAKTVDVPAIKELPEDIGPLPEGGMTAYSPLMPLATNSEEQVSQSGSAINLVKEVKLKQMSVAISKPAGQTFDFMDTVRLFISAPGLEEKLVAFKYGVPKGQQKLDLDCEAINLREYFIQDTMYVRFGGHFNAVPATESQLELNSTFNMLANPLQKAE